MGLVFRLLSLCPFKMPVDRHWEGYSADANDQAKKGDVLRNACAVNPQTVPAHSVISFINSDARV